jgi:hypothetical protein
MLLKLYAVPLRAIRARYKWKDSSRAVHVYGYGLRQEIC